MSYFVITSGESGIKIAKLLDGEEFREWIRDHTEGIVAEYHPVFLDSLPETDDGFFIQTPESAALVIKGDIVKPKPVKVVTEYEVE